MTEVVSDGSAAEPRAIEVGNEPRVIGRSEAADLSVLVPTVSRRHLEVRMDSGMVLVTDLGSGHGTYVNGERIAKPTPVRQGDLVSLGHDLVFLVSAVESSEIEALTDAAMAREAPVDSSLVELALSEPSERKRRDYHEALVGMLDAIAFAEDSETLLRCALDTLAAVMSADRYLVLLGDDAEAMRDGARLLADSAVRPELDQPPSRSIVRRALVSDQPVISFDAQTDQRFRKRGSIAMSNVRSAVCASMETADGTLGILYADNHVAAGLFSMPDGRFMRSVGRACALRLQQLLSNDVVSQQRERIGELERQRESVVGGVAGDVRSHLNRLDLIADELQHDHKVASAARLVRAEAARFQSDLDRVVGWTRRETTQPGDSSPRLGPAVAGGRRSSEVYDDELDAPEGDSLPTEAPAPDLPRRSPTLRGTGGQPIATRARGHGDGNGDGNGDGSGDDGSASIAAASDASAESAQRRLPPTGPLSAADDEMLTTGPQPAAAPAPPPPEPNADGDPRDDGDSSGGDLPPAPVKPRSAP